jgi:hypothetical protein
MVQKGREPSAVLDISSLLGESSEIVDTITFFETDDVSSSGELIDSAEVDGTAAGNVGSSFQFGGSLGFPDTGTFSETNDFSSSAELIDSADVDHSLAGLPSVLDLSPRLRESPQFSDTSTFSETVQFFSSAELAESTDVDRFLAGLPSAVLDLSPQLRESPQFSDTSTFSASDPVPHSVELDESLPGLPSALPDSQPPALSSVVPVSARLSDLIELDSSKTLDAASDPSRSPGPAVSSPVIISAAPIHSAAFLTSKRSVSSAVLRASGVTDVSSNFESSDSIGVSALPNSDALSKSSVLIQSHSGFLSDVFDRTADLPRTAALSTLGGLDSLSEAEEFLDIPSSTGDAVVIGTSSAWLVPTLAALLALIVFCAIVLLLLVKRRRDRTTTATPGDLEMDIDRQEDMDKWEYENPVSEDEEGELFMGVEIEGSELEDYGFIDGE